MNVRIIIAAWLMLAIALLPATVMWHSSLAAQDAGDGGDDDDDGGDEDDVDDPDEADPGDDAGDDDVGGGEDFGGDDVGGGEDFGGDDVGGGDDFGDDDAGDDAGGDDDATGGDGGDDDGAEGSSGDNDDATGGDDDSDDANGGDDDNDTTGNDDDDDGATSNDGADDDDDNDGDDRGETDDDDDDASEDQEPARWDVPAGDDASTRAELDEAEGIGADGDGFRYRRGEFIALDLTDEDLSELRSNGFEVIDSEKLESVDGTLLLLRGPAQMSDEASLDALDTVADPDSFGFNHLFDGSSVQTARKRGATVPARQACGCAIGLIDTGVATNLSYFKHITLVQRAFNGKDPQPRLHGTAVAQLMAGTRKHPVRPTKIFVADIFGGPRATSGSSFALVKALDWLAAQGVPVINISLSGPRNPAVASAIARITRKGHTIVAAAGNDGPAAPAVFPGAYDGVIGVTAVDGANRVYRYANRGVYVDFAARGVAVTAIDAQGGVRDATGTSFAAPVIAARLAGTLRTPDPAAAQKAIRALEAEARDLGAPGRDPVYGVGLIGDPK